MAIDEEVVRQAQEALSGIGRAAQPVISSFVGTANASDKMSEALKRTREQIKDHIKDRKELEDRLSKATTKAEQDKINDQIKSKNRQIASAEQSIKDSYNATGKQVASSIMDVVEKFSLGVDPFNDALASFADLKNVGGGMFDTLVSAAEGLADTMGNKVGRTAVGLFGKGLSGAGVAAEALGGTFDFFVAQLKAHAEEFKNITRAGIVLGDGITELAMQANEAGVGNVKQFALALQGAQPHIQNLGMAGGEASARLAKTMGDLRRGTERYGERLTGLGFDLKDQGELIAMSMAMNRAAGAEYANQQRDASKEAFQLGKNMRLLQEITGKDAKAATERARQESMRARVQATLQGDQLKSYQAATAAGGKTINQALTESLGPAGRITSQNLNILAAQVPEFGQEVERLTAMVKSGAKEEDVTKAMAQAENVLNNATRKFAQSAEGQGFVLAGTVEGANQRVSAVQEAMDEILARGLIDKKQIDAASGRVDKLGNLEDKMTAQVARITEESMAAQRAITDLAFKPTQMFTQGVELVSRGLTALAEKLSSVVDKIPDMTNYRELPTRSRAPRAEEILDQAKSLSEPRAMGGPINNNKSYLVGERGPELLVSREIGTMLSNLKLNSIVESAGNQSQQITAVLNKLSTMPESGDQSQQITAALDKLTGNFESMTQDTTEQRSFQNDMRQMMREQILLLRTHVDVSRTIESTMENIETIQSRIASSTV